MTIIEVFQTFQTQDQAIEYLESIRWRGEPACPYCGDCSVSRHASTDRKRPRWQCHECRRAFSVTVGTIFHGTHIALRDWFILLALMLNAKKSVSSCQAARDLGIRRQTVWTMMHRIRLAMANDKDQAGLLHGIVEADETSMDRKPPKDSRRADSGGAARRERETHKTQMTGGIELGERVLARPATPKQLNTAGLSLFIESHVGSTTTVTITDEFGGDDRIAEKLLHERVNHSLEYTREHIQTNNSEGFWRLLKRAWYGTHHHYSEKYMGLYIAEAWFKFNQRRGAPDLRSALRLTVA